MGPGFQWGSFPVNADRFIAQVKKLDNVVLSLGWSTEWKVNSTAVYEKQYMDAMEAILKNNNLNANDYKDFPINFPIRAPFALNSQDALKSFYDNLTKTNAATFTVQSEAGDAVDVEELKKFITTYGVEHIYIDLSDEVMKRLNLGDDGKGGKGGSGGGASTIVQYGLLNLITFTVIAFLRNWLYNFIS